MKITREVITDLLPAYLANEASSDTRALVELLVKLPVNPLPQDHERETLIRTQNMLRWRTHWLTMAILFTFMPLSSAFSSKGLTWIMIRDAPYAAQIFLILAVVSWIQFFRTRRKLRSSGI
jgi:hypothetical protein